MYLQLFFLFNAIWVVCIAVAGLSYPKLTGEPFDRVVFLSVMRITYLIVFCCALAGIAIAEIVF